MCFDVETFTNNIFTRGSIEMNNIRQYASRAIVFVMALSILVPAVMLTGDGSKVQAATLATLELTNKATKPEPLSIITQKAMACSTLPPLPHH